MYENWLLRRWETPISDAKHLFMDSLVDKDGHLQIDVGDYCENQAISRHRITFQNCPAYRNILEEYRLELWKRRREAENSKATGWTLLVEGSPWIREFDQEPLFGLLNEKMCHYVLITENDVIEILSNQEPSIESLPSSTNSAG